MTIYEFADLLDGRQYREEITRQEEQTAKENGFVVIYGASDDLCEIAGAISDEIDCYDGGGFYLYNGRVLSEDECADENYCVKAVWCPYYENCSWTYETSLPYAKFKIYKDDELYCIGIVVDIKSTYCAHISTGECLFTPDELETIQCALESACYDSQNRMSGLVYAGPEDTYLQEQLEYHRERLNKCGELLKKMKAIHGAETARKDSQT